MTLTLRNLAKALTFAALPIATAHSGEAVLYEVNGQAYEGWFEPATEPRGTVLILHDWDGLTEYEQKRAAMLADLGYDVFAADLFGAGIRPTKNEDKRQHTGELYKDREKMRAIMNAALDAAAAKGADTEAAVAMGYCFGGAAVLELARAGADLKGFVTFHGGLETPEGQDYSQTRGRVLILHGSADSAISMDQFAALTQQLESAGVAHEMITYGGAQHAFTVFGEDRYQEAADRKSWKRFTEFLGETLNP
jgi:dienelactone hydrolase